MQCYLFDTVDEAMALDATICSGENIGGGDTKRYLNILTTKAGAFAVKADRIARKYATRAPVTLQDGDLQ